MNIVTLLLSIVTFFSGIRSEHKSSIPQGGLPCSTCNWESSVADVITVGGGQITYNESSGGIIGPNFTPTSGPCTNAAHALATKKVKLEPFSIEGDTENCDSLREEIYGYPPQRLFQACYDSSKKFIMNCYNNSEAPSMFNYVSAGLEQLAIADSSLWMKGREWLESVMYLNTSNPEYFCADVEAISNTFTSPSDTTEELGWKATNRSLSVLRWLLQNKLCDSTALQREINGARASQYESWLNDTSVPLDTTIPPLDSVDSVLYNDLQKHFLYASVGPAGAEPILSNITAIPNPAQEGTVITFGISKEAYVKLELYDVLGHPLGTGGFESLCEPGNKSVPISLAGLPPGTYYARIQTAYGEVESVKIVKN